MPAITSEATPLPYALPTPLPLLHAMSNATATTLSALQRRLQPDAAAADSTPLSSVASIILSNFLPTYDTAETATPAAPTFSLPSIESLVASSAEDLSNFRDVTFDIFDDDDDLFGSPLAFDASENGLWNGRFVPPPPRPPFFVDEPVLSDGLTTCDLCSWAMPTKSTFIFEGTIEKASELGWPLTLIIVSIFSALVGAIIMVTVVRCRRKKASNNRNGKCQQPLKQQPTTPLPSPNHHLHHHHHNLHPDNHYHQHALAQLPLHSHHTAYTSHYAGPHYFQHQPQQQHYQHQHQQQQQQQQQQHHHYPRNSCSSSSLTNESSSSTNHTSLSSIYHPPSYYNNQPQYAPQLPQVPQPQHPPPKVNNISARFSRQKSLPKNINMLTRPLPPQPFFDSGDDELDRDHDAITADAVSYEEPVLAADAAAVMVAAHSIAKT